MFKYITNTATPFNFYSTFNKGFQSSFFKRQRTSKLSTHYNNFIFADQLDRTRISKNCLVSYHLKNFYPQELKSYCYLLYILPEFNYFGACSRTMSALVYYADRTAILSKTSVCIGILAQAGISMWLKIGVMLQAGNGAERTRRRSQYWSNRYSSILLKE